MKGFKKCCISNAVDRPTDDDILWNGSDEDRNARSECEEDGDSDTD